jgi:hypothetical protein
MLVGGCVGQPPDVAEEGEQAALATAATSSPPTDDGKRTDAIVPFDWDEVLCWTTDFPPYSCRTTPIPAHRSQHWVRAKVGIGGWYTVKDLDTGAIVDRGNGTWTWKQIGSPAHPLLGNHYQLSVTSSNGDQVEGLLDNCTSGCRNH